MYKVNIILIFSLYCSYSIAALQPDHATVAIYNDNSRFFITEEQRDAAITGGDAYWINPGTFMARLQTDSAPAAFLALYPYPDVPEPEEPEERIIPPQRYYTLENEYLSLRVDMRACGMVDQVWIDGVNVVDGNDNGRGFQFDMSTGEECCDDNEFPNVPHRRIETPTQGGGYRQASNYPLAYSVTTNSISTTCVMVDYWDRNSRETEWRLDYEVEVSGPLVRLTGRIYHRNGQSTHLDAVTPWIMLEPDSVPDRLPEYSRWNVDPAFLSEGVGPVELGGIEVDGLRQHDSRNLLMWVTSGTTGTVSYDRTKPDDAINLSTGVRYWPKRDVRVGEKLPFEAYVDFSGLVESVGDPPDPPEISAIYTSFGPVHTGTAQYAKKVLNLSSAITITTGKSYTNAEIWFYGIEGAEIDHKVVTLQPHVRWHDFAPDGAENIFIESDQQVHIHTYVYSDGPTNMVEMYNYSIK